MTSFTHRPPRLANTAYSFRPARPYTFRPGDFARHIGTGDMLLITRDRAPQPVVEAVRLRDLRAADFPPVLVQHHAFDLLRFVLWQTLEDDLVGEWSPGPGVIADIHAERQRQHAKWGAQRHSLERWVMILGEEIGEVSAAIGEHIFRQAPVAPVRAELIQVAAVAVQIIEQLDREHPGGNPS